VGVFTGASNDAERHKLYSKMSKILIYRFADLANRARMAGINAGGQAIKKAWYESEMPVVVKDYDYYNDHLQLRESSRRNNIFLRLDNEYEIEFIDATINLTKASDIKSTALVNRAGTVKERIQEKDYGVVIKGTLQAERDRFPWDEMHNLNRILSAAKSIEVASVYLSLFDIYKLAFKTATFNQTEWTHFNIMPFSLTFESDMDYDFLISD
jgi:hypothetical protein